MEGCICVAFSAGYIGQYCWWPVVLRSAVSEVGQSTCSSSFPVSLLSPDNLWCCALCFRREKRNMACVVSACGFCSSFCLGNLADLGFWSGSSALLALLVALVRGKIDPQC